MEYNLKDPSTLDQIVQLVESSENQQRILKHTTDYQIINGNQFEHIKKTLQTRYPKTWDRMIIIDLKIGDKIIRKLSRVYANGVKREVVDRDTGVVNPLLTDLINYIYNDINAEGEDFNDILIKANKYYQAHEYVEIFAYEDPDGYIRIKALSQHVFTAIANEDKTVADVIVFKNSISDFSNPKNFIDYNLLANELDNLEIIASYTVWSKDENFSFVRVQGNDKYGEEEGQIVWKNVITNNDDNPTGINPYEIMTFTAIKRSTEGHFYPYGSEIARMSKECNVVLCDLVTIAINQGFGQAVIYYEGENPPKEINSGYTNVIALPNNEGKSRFEFANANADIKGVLEVDSHIIRLLLSTNDLTTDKVSGELQATNFASAIDRLIADNESIENTIALRKKFVNAEQKLFKIILSILQYQVKTQTLHPDYPKVTLADVLGSYKLKLTFNEIRPLVTEKEKIDTIVAAENAGLILPWEKHIKYNENLTPKEAEEREKLIEEYKKKLQEAFFQNQKPGSGGKNLDQTFKNESQDTQDNMGDMPMDNEDNMNMDGEDNGGQTNKEVLPSVNNRKNQRGLRTKEAPK